MAGIPRSIVKANSREQLLSSDLNRMQWLASREDQDQEAARSRSFDSSAATPASAANLLSTIGAPISGLDKVPTYAFDSGYQSIIGAGSGYVYAPAFPTLNADDSPYLVARWAQTTVTFGNPHATLPRIDLVVATVNSVDADSQSRFVLVDPVTRAITPQNVFKTSNPLATVSVVAGSPGSSPAVPSVPANAIPLFYVWVVASAGTASSFGVARASWRRVGQPWASMSGVVSGMGLKWDLTADPTAATAAMIAKGFHRVLIDGELMEFYANMDSTVGGVLPDTGNNPFSVAAAATWHKPYYIYAAGGRRNPVPSFNTSDGVLSPVTIVESLTAPDLSTGKPTANLTVGGVTVTPNGAVFIGIGFVAMNSTRRLACIMGKDMVTVPNMTGNALQHTFAGTGVEQIGDLAAMPATSNVAWVIYAHSSTVAKQVISLFPDRGDGAGRPTGQANAGSFTLETGLGATPFHARGTGYVEFQPGSLKRLWGSGTAADVTDVIVVGYDHGVRMLGLRVNP